MMYRCLSCGYIGDEHSFFDYCPANKKIVDTCPNCGTTDSKETCEHVDPETVARINEAAEREERARKREESSFDGMK